MSEDEYYNMLPANFAAKIEGYSRRVYRDEEISRKLAFFCLAPHTVRGFTYQRFCKEYWQIAGDPQEVTNKEIKERARELTHDQWEHLKKRQSQLAFEATIREQNKKLQQQRRRKYLEQSKN